MSTLEEKILDGPTIHYCDSDDDTRASNEDGMSQNDNDEGGTDENNFSRNSCTRNNAANLFRRPNDERLNRISQVNWRSSGSTNTGPKGVIEDFKKLSGEQKGNNVDDLEAEFQALLNNDSLLKEYVSKRMTDAIKSNAPTFGQVFHLQTGQQLLDAIDKENPSILVIVHIYTKYSRPCLNLNRCLDQLANEYKCVKFVTLDASVTGLSGNFKENGVPALLVYRKGDLVKSLIQLNELLDKDFETSQVRDLLIDIGVLI